ncbi:hypothetical protein EJ06DRAFT_315594 [Trichodelitschia bisporula]|uniref:Uncharacterized protein n=1 Tax=Trichodelitschia bisporula TaxID=703511 RepID=A0A6G1I3S4_9PEZI|nr:hypothetical protein EJ06DRAFT_315594 [Trichodelitschia bisporula]
MTACPAAMNAQFCPRPSLTRRHTNLCALQPSPYGAPAAGCRRRPPVPLSPLGAWYLFHVSRPGYVPCGKLSLDRPISPIHGPLPVRSASSFLWIQFHGRFAGVVVSDLSSIELPWTPPVSRLLPLMARPRLAGGCTTVSRVLTSHLPFQHASASAYWVLGLWVLLIRNSIICTGCGQEYQTAGQNCFASSQLWCPSEQPSAFSLRISSHDVSVQPASRQADTV